MVFFFFSSRRRHTRWPRDWSSDVCSSDLVLVAPDRHEFLGELSLVDREAEVHAPRRGQQEEIAFPYDAEMLQEEAALEELLPGRLALPLRDCDAPGPHDAAMPRPAVKRFRVSRKRS